MTETTGTPRRWLITGASTGFGRALAEAVLAAGDAVVATARNPAALADLAAHPAATILRARRHRRRPGARRRRRGRSRPAASTCSSTTRATAWSARWRS